MPLQVPPDPAVPTAATPGNRLLSRSSPERLGRRHDLRKAAIQYEFRPLANFRRRKMTSRARLHGEGQCCVTHKLHFEPNVRRMPRGCLATLLRADARDQNFLDVVTAKPILQGDASCRFAE